MCGVFGVYGHPEAANIAYLGIHALQHRGQESAGIVASDGATLRGEFVRGLVADNFGQQALARLPGSAAIGHVRYSTSGGSDVRNAQPFIITYSQGQLGLGHNGNLVNAPEIRRQLEARGSIFQSTSDTEVIVHLLALAEGADEVERLVKALKDVRGAYALVILTPRRLIAVRDPFGFRPLALAKLGTGFAVASETCAFDLVGAQFLREIEPGEMVVIDADGMRSSRPFEAEPGNFCVFEHVYFARPDSRVNKLSVYAARKSMGRQLARQAPVVADVVVPVPDSGISAALGFSNESGIPYELGLIRSHYVGRTFIEPQQSIRDFGVRLKLNAVREVLDGKRVVVVDDSIVRGTTARKIVKMVRDAGAKEVHVRISSPPTINPCFYGIDTPNRSELIAASSNTDEIAKYLGCDSLAYLSADGLMSAVGAKSDQAGWCTACFTGRYPVPPALSERPASSGS